ncbi:MAG: 3-phosphoserine/phosphohydroxythreonine transaminase [Pirellulaceae bacterium]
MSVATATDRVFNFSAGPAVLPLPVLEQAQRELVCLPGVGASVMEISHRSPAFEAILSDATERLKSLLNVPENYRILFLQGGSRLQFSMIPMNLLRGSQTPAEYLVTGSWSQKAVDEALREGPVRITWDGKPHKFDRVPADSDLQIDPQTPYAYITSNETIQGVQFHTEPNVGEVPLVCDASSDFLHRPVDINRYGILYACAQKNAGPAGVTIVIIREDLLARGADSLPGYLNYREHAENNSMYNTPPTFAIYMFGLVAKWLQEEIGGLDAMHALNREKAAMLYEVVDASNGFYGGHAQPESRSLMNVTFRLPNADVEKEFHRQANARGLTSLEGHRSVGGVRASIYNAMPREGVVELRDFMKEFYEQQA